MIRAWGPARLLGVALALAGVAHAAGGEAPAARERAREAPAGTLAAGSAADSVGVPYRALVRTLAARSVQDTIGNGAYAFAMRAYQEERFDEAVPLLKAFAKAHPRNLSANDALETMFLIRDNRDFDDRPLRLHRVAMNLRAAGRVDSAEAMVRAGLAKYPGANLRHHWNYVLAEISRDRGQHDAAVGFALAVADTANQTRLAPYALRLAGDETLAAGRDPARAVRYYQELLERFPESPLAPPVRAQLLELRKKLQL